MLDGAPTFADLPHVRCITIMEFEGMRMRNLINEMFGPAKPVNVVDLDFQNPKPVSSETRRRMSEAAKARVLQ